MRILWLAVLLAGVSSGALRAIEPVKPDYILLDTNKTSTMQKELQDATDKGYRLVSGQGTWLLSAVMEKPQVEPEPIEYMLLSTSKSSTMQKEMNETSAKGYRFASVLGLGDEVVLAMQRKKGATTRSHEQKLLATKRFRTMEKELLAATAEGYRFVGQTYFTSWTGQEYVAIMERPVQ